MAVANLQVAATVVDLAGDKPLNTDTFFVDTNAWVPTVYSPATYPGLPPVILHHQTRYPQYMSDVLSSGGTLMACGLNFAELAHVIERTERSIFNASNGTTVETKEFRHNYPAERDKVVREIESAWQTIEKMATLITIPASQACIATSLATARTEILDGADYLIIRGLLTHGIVNVITDDSDFATVTGITIFTVNRAIISAARRQGQLAKR